MKKFLNFLNRINEELNEKPKSSKFLYLIISVLLPLALFYNFYYTPKQEKKKRLIQDIQALNAEIIKYEKIAQREREIEFVINERKKFLAECQKILPNEKEIPELLNNIAKLANKRNLKVLQFIPKSEVQKNYYNEIPIELNIVGSFKNIFDFLNDVENMDRLVNLVQVDISSQDRNTLMIKGTLHTFKYTGIELKTNQGKK